MVWIKTDMNCSTIPRETQERKCCWFQDELSSPLLVNLEGQNCELIQLKNHSIDSRDSERLKNTFQLWKQLGQTQALAQSVFQ